MKKLSKKAAKLLHEHEKHAALVAFGEAIHDAWDFSLNRSIVCPYCGLSSVKLEYDWRINPQIQACSRCDNEYIVTVNSCPLFTTSRIE